MTKEPPTIEEELAEMPPELRRIAEKIGDLGEAEPPAGYEERFIERAQREGVIPATSEVMTHADVLKRLYHLCENKFDQVACEVALFYLEHELSASNFSLVDSFLREADVERLSSSCLLAVLTITIHGRERLAQRQNFLELAGKKMRKDLGIDRAQKLLETRR